METISNCRVEKLLAKKHFTSEVVQPPSKMSSLSLQTLSNEILLALIQRVEFSSANLNLPILVNRLFHDVIAYRGRRLLNDIAEVQCPYALTAYRYPRSLLAINNYPLSMGAQ